MNIVAVGAVLLTACSVVQARPLDQQSVLKTFFETGDKPTQSQFAALIDSNLAVTADGVESPQWDGIQLESTNPAFDSGLDSMSTMDALIVSLTSSPLQGGAAERTLSIEFTFGNDQGLWVADGLAVFTSIGPADDFHNANNELRWELSVAPTLSLGGDPLNGQRSMTAGTYLTTEPVPAPASLATLLGAAAVISRRRR